MKKSKNNKRPFFRFVKQIVRKFNKKPEFVQEENILDEACIYISNHAAASGPTKYELYLPMNIQITGAYQMCGTLRQRWKYLFKTYFHQKKHLPKWLAFIVATLVTPFMIMFYAGMQIIPIYPDSRFKRTINKSIKALEKGISIVIFPEDSSDGYHDELTGFFGGFWLIAKEYFKKTGKDINIVNMYYHKSLNKVLVDKPYSYKELAKKIKGHKDAAKMFLDNTNNLYKQLLISKE